MLKKRIPREKLPQSENILASLNILGIEPDSLHDLIDELPVHLWIHDENNKIFYANQGFIRKFGPCLAKSCYKALQGRGEICSCCKSTAAYKSRSPEKCAICRRCNNGYDVSVTHTPVTNVFGENFILKSSFFINNISTLENKNKRVKDSINEKFVVVCSGCKKAKINRENWTAIDHQTIANFNVPISHGLCQECVKILYPDLLALQDSPDPLVSSSE